jgi:hypothetical protein
MTSKRWQPINDLERIALPSSTETVAGLLP